MPNIMNYNFTADVEKKFDDIAEGKTEWTTFRADATSHCEWWLFLDSSAWKFPFVTWIPSFETYRHRRAFFNALFFRLFFQIL